MDIHNHYPSMGYRQIRGTLLLQTGETVSAPSVWRCMKRSRISGYVRRQGGPVPSGIEHNRYANVLDRKFQAKYPCEKIVTDVTYLRNQGSWYLNLYNNEIVE